MSTIDVTNATVDVTTVDTTLDATVNNINNKIGIIYNKHGEPIKRFTITREDAFPKTEEEFAADQKEHDELYGKEEKEKEEHSIIRIMEKIMGKK